MQDNSSKIYMDAVLQPSRSLSDRGFVTLILILTGLSILTSLAFLPYGFFIILGFLAIDLLILWLAFRSNNKTLSQRTFVQVTSENLKVVHINPQGNESSAVLPTAFTQVGLTPQGDDNKFIKLSSSGRSYVIGRFLTPEERLSFVASLKDALQNARAERYI